MMDVEPKVVVEIKSEGNFENIQYKVSGKKTVKTNRLRKPQWIVYMEGIGLKEKAKKTLQFCVRNEGMLLPFPGEKKQKSRKDAHFQIKISVLK